MPKYTSRDDTCMVTNNTNHQDDVIIWDWLSTKAMRNKVTVYQRDDVSNCDVYNASCRTSQLCHYTHSNSGSWTVLSLLAPLQSDKFSDKTADTLWSRLYTDVLLWVSKVLRPTQDRSFQEVSRWLNYFNPLTIVMLHQPLNWDCIKHLKCWTHLSYTTTRISNLRSYKKNMN